MRQVLIYPDESGMWVAEAPSLPGCVSQGTTQEEAIAGIKEAIDLYLETLASLGKSVPPEDFRAMLIAV